MTLQASKSEVALHQRFDGNHEPFAKHYPEGTITLTGISKWAGAGGWRLGAFVFPSSLRWLLNAMAVYASETHSCVAAPIQYGAVPAFAAHRDTPQGQYMRHYLKASRSILGAIGEAFAEVVCGGLAVAEKPHTSLVTNQRRTPQHSFGVDREGKHEKHARFSLRHDCAHWRLLCMDRC